MSFIDDLKSDAINWALNRLNEKATWVGWTVAAAAKFGVSLTPEADNLLVNSLLGIVVFLSYVIKGGPVILERKR